MLLSEAGQYVHSAYLILICLTGVAVGETNPNWYLDRHSFSVFTCSYLISNQQPAGNSII